MRTLVHLSDLHFGRVDPVLVKPLIEVVSGLKPDLVAISGDFTQRARTSEFVEAKAFLEQIPKPQIVVPGNHDVPLYNLLARFGMPLAKYRLHISNDLAPFYGDDEIAVIGVNTARSFTRKGGRISREQIEAVATRMRSMPENVIRIVVTHHPFDVPPGHTERDLVGRAQAAMEAWSGCGPDVFLSGHLHLSQISQTAKRYKVAGRSALVVQAGTTMSTRGRGEANAFNVIRIERDAIAVERFEWGSKDAQFARATVDAFERGAEGWVRKAADDVEKTELPAHSSEGADASKPDPGPRGG